MEDTNSSVFHSHLTNVTLLNFLREYLTLRKIKSNGLKLEQEKLIEPRPFSHLLIIPKVLQNHECKQVQS